MLVEQNQPHEGGVTARGAALSFSSALVGCVSFEPDKTKSDAEPEHAFPRPATVAIEGPKNVHAWAFSPRRGSFDASNRAEIRNRQFLHAFEDAFSARGYGVVD
jgi:hypothetical protein